MTDLNDLKSKIPVVIRGMRPSSERVDIFFSDLTHLSLFHFYDCCESVTLVDVAGDPKDLIGRPLALCEVSISEPAPGETEEHGTVTWYKFVTMEGAVTLRWLGESNGFYSEEVEVRIELTDLNLLTAEERAEWDRVQTCLTTHHARP